MDRISIKGVSKQYEGTFGKPFVALNQIDLDIPKGETIAIVGESGSGKSTLAKMIVGIEKPTKGSIFIDEENCVAWDYAAWRKHRCKIQAVFQDASGTLNPMRSTYQNVEEALVNLTSLSTQERKKRIYELMEEMGLSQTLLDTKVKFLSGGEQRRLSLLRALAIRPAYLILDEVTSGLDLLSADDVLCTLERYIKYNKCSCIFITHDMELAYRIADRIIVMRYGSIINIGNKKRKVV